MKTVGAAFGVTGMLCGFIFAGCLVSASKPVDQGVGTGGDAGGKDDFRARCTSPCEQRVAKGCDAVVSICVAQCQGAYMLGTTQGKCEQAYELYTDCLYSSAVIDRVCPPSNADPGAICPDEQAAYLLCQTSGQGSDSGAGDGGGSSSSAGIDGGSERDGGIGETSGSGGSVGCSTAACQCGAFPIPNPASAGLPNPASYAINADGTVTDNVTHLVWERTVDAARYTQPDAVAHCAAKGGDWHLPTRLQLVSLLDFTIVLPHTPINPVAFPGAPLGAFWTSTPYASESNTSWYVADYSAVGRTSFDYYGARCVRGTPTCNEARYQVQSAGLVRDAATGLTWQRAVNDGGTGQDWATAKATCAILGTGWRLPSATELQSIVDDTRANPAIDQVAFPETPNDAFWTSSPSASSPTAIWLVDFSTGAATYFVSADTDSRRVRCVR